jgi:hypothetical protein
MDNTKVDIFTKEIISGSKQELTNPDFNRTLMRKIKAENQKKIIYSNLKLYSIIFISIDASIIVLLNLTGIGLSDVSFKISSFSRAFENFYSDPTQLVIVYFTVLVAVILLIMMISRNGYSKTQEVN